LGLKNKTKQKTNLYVFIFLSMVVWTPHPESIISDNILPISD
jgi:hypothetical protein